MSEMKRLTVTEALHTVLVAEADAADERLGKYVSDALWHAVRFSWALRRLNSSGMWTPESIAFLAGVAAAAKGVSMEQYRDEAVALRVLDDYSAIAETARSGLPQGPLAHLSLAEAPN